jgi:hypothetical protein
MSMMSKTDFEDQKQFRGAQKEQKTPLVVVAAYCPPAL